MLNQKVFNSKQSRKGRTQNKEVHRKQKVKWQSINPSVSIILNVNELSQRQRLSDWFLKNDLTTCNLPEDVSRFKYTKTLKAKGNLIYYTNNHRKTEVAILISDKTNLKTNVIRDKEGNLLM